MKTWIHITGWGVILATMALLFYLFPPMQAHADFDADTPITLLTDEGSEHISMAEYLPGAVAAEMPASFAEEALKAQAVAARTYALHTRKHGENEVCADSGCCLAYKTEDELSALWGSDYESNMRRIRNAVSATDGEILTYGGETIQAVFHASSFGATESSGNVWTALPYLVSVSTPETANAVPNLVTRAVFTPEALCRSLGTAASSSPEAWLGKAERDEAGRINSLEIAGKAYSGTALRTALGLRSTDFSVEYTDGSFVFTVFGYGHGVGMSQYGANLLAADGWSYDAILMHYYPGAVIQRQEASAQPR